MKTKDAPSSTRAALELDPAYLLTKQQYGSVRSTFNLTKKADAILDALAEQAGVTQREIFDQAMRNGWLAELANQIKIEPKPETGGTRLTLVMSQSAMEALRKVSRESGVARDLIACAVIQQFYTAYNSQVEHATKIANEVIRCIDEAIGLIDTQAAQNYIDKEAPEKYRELIKNLLGEAVDLIADQWINVPRQFSAWQNGLADVYEMANDLKPVKLSDEDK